MVGVAQLVRAAGCGPAGRGFKSRHSPHFFCQNFGGALGVSPFFVSESRTFATKTVVPPAFARVQSGVPSCPRAPPWLFVVALRSGFRLRSGSPRFARCVVQQVAGSSLVTHPIFLPKFWAKKITKTQVFTSRGEAALHSKAAGFSSHLHQTPEALLVKTLHFIPLVKAFRYRFTCEVAACGGRMCFFFYCASLKRRQAALKFTFPHKISPNSSL